MRRILSFVLCGLLLIAPAVAVEKTAPGPSRAAEQTAAAPKEPAPPAARELTPEETAGLSARAEEPGPEVAGGALTTTQLTYAVIALAAAVIVLIAK